MPKKKILYIVGAGASSEVNLPTGDKLKEEIAYALDIRFEDGYSQSSGDRGIVDAFKIHVQEGGINWDINPHLKAAGRIRTALPQAISIDNFIDTHKDNKKIELCGKLAIVQTILKAERNSLLYFDQSNRYNTIDFYALEKTWYSKFMMLLTENCTIEALSKRLKSIALIIFNYDRCVEHFLYNSIQNYYGIQPEDAAKLVDEIEIYHPYGVVGSLPWQRGQSVAFGANPHPKQLLKLASQIKTFTEGTDTESSEIAAIRNNVAGAATIVFLGFAFHKLNMELMSAKTLVPDLLEETAYFGTAFGISDSDCDIIESDLQNFNGNNANKIFINNKLTCTNLFTEYWRNLSLN